MDLLEAVEKTLLHNQAQIRRLRRAGMALAALALLGWLAAALLVADRFYRDGTNDAGDVADSRPVGEPQRPDTAAAQGTQASESEQASGAEATGADGPGRTTGDLFLEPQAYEDRDVTVTGSVIELLSRYRLRSETGPNTIVIDIDGLPPAVRSAFSAALAEAGPLRGVRARIMGKVERGDAAAFHLAASELVLLD